MRIYRPTSGHLICGHWNQSPVEIGVTPVQGRAELQVEKQPVPLETGTVVMVAPGERHRVKWVDPVHGVRWVIVKERSAPDSKHVC